MLLSTPKGLSPMGSGGGRSACPPPAQPDRHRPRASAPPFSPAPNRRIFCPASPEIRAQRRYDELKAKGQAVDFDEILENVKQRDYIDQHREVSPLRKADDALLLDNSHLTIEQQKEWLAEQFARVAGN